MGTHHFLLLSVALLVVGCAYGQQPPGARQQRTNSPIMQIKKSVDKKLCSDTDYTADIVAKIEDCDKFDPHYKIDVKLVFVLKNSFFLLIIFCDLIDR